MKLVFLLLLVLLGSTDAATPPVVRVRVSPITAAVYLQARQLALAIAEKRAFPLRKSEGKILVPTTAGNQIFRDKKSAVETENVTYDYLGYLPRQQQHLLRKSYWEGEERLVEVVLAVQRDGYILKFDSEPIYSPDQKHIAIFQQIPDYESMINDVQVLEKKAKKIRLLWQANPETWEPKEAFWATDSTAYIKQERYKIKRDDAKDGVRYKPARFTYVQLLVR